MPMPFFKVIINGYLIFQGKDMPSCFQHFSLGSFQLLQMFSYKVLAHIVTAVESSVYLFLPSPYIILPICCQLDSQNGLSFIHISLITNQGKYCFACLLVICISTSEHQLLCSLLYLS